MGKVWHRTFLRVNEEESEAAAATALLMKEEELHGERFNMIVNRPFFCAIRDDDTGALLFMGSIVDPD